jgi:hypothetical protein
MEEDKSFTDMEIKEATEYYFNYLKKWSHIPIEEI